MLARFNYVYDWVLGRYGNETFPGEITKLVASDADINVMRKSGTAYWKWPAQEDKIFYTRNDIMKKLDPPIIAGISGQF